MTAPRRAIHFPDRRQHRETKVSGSFWVSTEEQGVDVSFWFVCPCGCGQFRRITVGHWFKPKTSGASWHWNGSLTEPTLSPSVNCAPVDACHGWHGWLRDGYWEAC